MQKCRTECLAKFDLKMETIEKESDELVPWRLVLRARPVVGHRVLEDGGQGDLGGEEAQVEDQVLVHRLLRRRELVGGDLGVQAHLGILRLIKAVIPQSPSPVAITIEKIKF